MKVFLPFIFLPFFHLPTLILTFPVFFQNLLSVNEVMRSFGYHYTTGMTPFVFIAAIYGFQAVTEKFVWVGKHRSWLAALLLFFGLMRAAPAEYFFLSQSLAHRTAHNAFILEKLKNIPQEARVLTHNNFIPQTVNRREIHQFDYRTEPTKGEQAQSVGADYVIWDQAFWEPNSYSPEIASGELLNMGYRKIFEKDGFVIFHRGEAT
jgi:uncharacterized membrane protein